MIKKLISYFIVIVAGVAILYYANVSIIKEGVRRAVFEAETKINEIKSHKLNAINQARILLDARLKSGYDLENRPCLSEEIVPGWAVDVVHQPFEETDRMPKNQCQLFLQKKVKNIIFLDEYGHVIDNGIKLGL
ncbi:hypothetical protein C4569_03245 [Candidatus Parcubacteria bacterium]|nr:MAG: hypothetical protein C4569_03245 [Candidatus Parcubacteria bacterium]